MMFLDLFAGLGCVALFTLPGLSLTRLIPALRRLPLPRQAAYGYLLGLAALGMGLYALSFLGVPLRRPAIFTLAVLLLLLPLFFLRRSAEAKRPVAPPGGRRSLLLAAGAAGTLLSLGVLSEAVTDPLTDWDGRMTWSTQARYLRAAGSVRPPVLEEARWSVTHPRYPLLLPIAQATVMEAFGAEPDRQIFRSLYAAFLPALLLVLYDGACRWAGRDAAALTVLAACSLPMIAFSTDGGAAGAYSDLPLACFYGAALLILLSPAPRLADGIAGGVFLAAAVLTKNEGAPLAAAALAVSALFLRRARLGRGSARAWARLAAASLVTVLAMGFLTAWRSGIPNREDEDYTRTLSFEKLWPEVVARTPRLVPGIASCMARWETWQGFWFVAMVVFLAGWRGLRRRITPPLLLAAAAPLAVAWAAYSVYWSPEFLVQATWNRMLVQAAVPTLLLLSLALRDLLRRAGLARSGGAWHATC